MTRTFNRKSEQQKRRSLRKSMTKAEVLLWMQLKNRRVLGQRVLRQYSVGAYVLDFYIPKLKLAIEVDGATHVTEQELEYDRNRENEIASLGIQFLRFTNAEIYHSMNGVIGRITERMLSLSSNPPGSPLHPKGGSGG